MNDIFDSPGIQPLFVGRRFEPMYVPERRTWCVIDRLDGSLHPACDRGEAVERAAIFEGVRRLLADLAAHFSVQRERQ